jgi:murein DD-endopeptidase MepM/ murein hydrolase activator NlpD
MSIRRFVTAGVLLGCLLFGPGVVEAASPPDEAAATAHFGIAAQKYDIERERVSSDETFADLLEPYGVSNNTAVRLARAVRPAFDVRHVQPGNAVRVYVNPWLQRPRYVVYRIDPVRHVVFNVQHPSESHLARRNVERDWTMVQGTIESSLYETLTQNDAHPALALRLSEVFAWQIDFFRLYDGDSFRVLYEKRVVDGQRVAPGKIIAAVFEHKEDRFVGIRFDDGSEAKYFNRDGQSLRRELLKAPLRYTRISSGYSNNRYHPVLKRYRPHHGTDYAAPRGTPVHSVGSGTVVKAGYYGNNGNYVKIRHNGTYTSGYLHLVDIADGIEPGATVQQGETIGYVGSTGMSTGPHLDYRLWKRGRAVDPYELELPPSRPVHPTYRAAFEQLVHDRLNRLYPLRVFRRSGSSPDAIAGQRHSLGDPLDFHVSFPS